MTRSRNDLRKIRHRRIRARLQGTAERPRLSVFRSAKHLSAQLIDDAAGRTLLAMSDRHLAREAVAAEKGRPGLARAAALGKLLAERAKEKGITTVVFDRSGYAYAGQVRALAEGARASGLTF